jgi:hypothetical protein
LFEGGDLFEGYGSSKTIPILPYKCGKTEHDLLPRQQTRVAPGLERPLRTIDGGSHLVGCTLGHARDDSLRGWVTQVNPSACL